MRLPRQGWERCRVRSESWDETVDFLVVGSGAGGMTAAIRAHDLGASTLVIEKASRYGGSTALSGGVAWVPNNSLMAAAGIEDSAEEGFVYLEAITAGSSSSERLHTYVETAPRMLSYLAENSRVCFTSVPDYPDYYPEAPGGKQGGRSCEPCEISAKQLGEEYARQNEYDGSCFPNYFPFLRSLVVEGKPLLRMDREGTRIFLRDTCRYFFDLPARLRRRQNDRLTLGPALAARCRLSLMDRKVPLWFNSSLEDLILEEGRVVGALVRKEGIELRVRAHKGVLLAAGGFEHNAALRRQYQPAPTGNEWTAGTPTNTGDTIAIGQKIGASFDLLEDSWWCPVFRAPEDPSVRLMIFEKNLDGGIIVDSQGERFMNEAVPYNDAGKEIYRANTNGASSIPAFLIFDYDFRKKYPVGSHLQWPVTTDRRAAKRYPGYMKKDATLRGLAQQIGVDADGLLRTVERFNGFARTGKDLDFGRGESAQDRYYTIRTDLPNPNLGPIEKGPFYALEVWPGDLGTKGGLRTDTHARVLDTDGEAIGGLYATGNCSASVMGHTYPGAGGTIGPAMTFGFIAAECAAG